MSPVVRATAPQLLASVAVTDEPKTFAGALQVPLYADQRRLEKLVVGGAEPAALSVNTIAWPEPSDPSQLDELFAPVLMISVEAAKPAVHDVPASVLLARSANR